MGMVMIISGYVNTVFPDTIPLKALRDLDSSPLFSFIGGMEMNFTELLKQVQKMQEQAKKIQEQLADKTVTVSSGGGMVTVTMTGRQEIKEIKLDPICVDSRDIPMLEDLILAAVNQAVLRSKELAAEEMKQLTGGIPLPFDLF